MCSRSFKFLSEHNYFTGYHTPHQRHPCCLKRFIFMTLPQQPRDQRDFLLLKSLLLGWSSCLHDSHTFLHANCEQGQGQGQSRYGRLLCQLPPAGTYLEQAPVLPHMCLQRSVNSTLTALPNFLPPCPEPHVSTIQ